jgi:hypothetical protein
MLDGVAQEFQFITISAVAKWDRGTVAAIAANPSPSIKIES